MIKHNFRGRLTQNAPLSKMTWFRVGGQADILFEPADVDDLKDFLRQWPVDSPVTMIGACSNVIIRDGGIRGAVIKLGKSFGAVKHDENTSVITAGSGAMDVVVARYASQYGLGGLEFLSGIPGNIGGALRMNAGAYGTEISDVLIDADVMDRQGNIYTICSDDMGFSYRCNGLSDDVIFIQARLKTYKDSVDNIQSKMDDIKEKRNASQPVKDRTGGSTFANPDDDKAWRLVESVGGRDLKIGGAEFSEKHCNFMVNTGDATAKDLEDLGDIVRQKIIDQHGVTLKWEIKRIGDQ
jgi:UDP-N-acetylmuramate dehydrogenase